MARLIDRLKKEHKAFNSNEARNWLEKQLEGGNKTFNSIQKNAQYSTEPIIGRMFLYKYSPITADKLPYWDMYPLVFPFMNQGHTFTGINLHYLEPNLRIKLLDGLINVSQTKLDKNTKLQMSFNLLGHVGNLVKPCIKKYRYDRVRSGYINIDPDDWHMTCLLPLQRFQKAGSGTVWSASRDQAMGF